MNRCPAPKHSDLVFHSMASRNGQICLQIRQLLSLMTFVKWTRAAQVEMEELGYSTEQVEAVGGYLGILTNRLFALSP